MGTHSGGTESAADFAGLVDAAAFEYENILHGNDFAFHTGDLGNGNHLAGAVRQAGNLYDAVDGGGNLVANGPLGNVEVGHRDHVLHAAQGVAHGVGVDRGERTFMTGIHGLQHIEGFFPADLADDDAVGTHTQAVDHQLPLADRAFAFDVGGASLETDYMLLLKLQFCGVFDGDDALHVGNVAGKH